jgi:hypothetical protein
MEAGHDLMPAFPLHIAVRLRSGCGWPPWAFTGNASVTAGKVAQPSRLRVPAASRREE